MEPKIVQDSGSWQDCHIPITVLGSRIEEAFTWILDNGCFENIESKYGRDYLEERIIAWSEVSREIRDLYYRTVHFDAGLMPWLSDNQRMLFKLTFAI